MYQPVAPYAFEGAYSHCFDHAAGAMDRRHIYLMHDILMSWPFENALEIGSLNGASSTAFVEAINRGQRMSATFCDVAISQSLKNVVASCYHPNRVRIVKEPSWVHMDRPDPYDFIFVDAGHDLASVSLEISRLLVRRPLCVMGHDTAAMEFGYSPQHYDGSDRLAKTFMFAPGYQWVEDWKFREGEHTERGLFFATRDPKLYEIAQELYRKWD